MVDEILDQCMTGRDLLAAEIASQGATSPVGVRRILYQDWLARGVPLDNVLLVGAELRKICLNARLSALHATFLPAAPVAGPSNLPAPPATNDVVGAGGAAELADDTYETYDADDADAIDKTGGVGTSRGPRSSSSRRHHHRVPEQSAAEPERRSKRIRGEPPASPEWSQ